MKHNQPGWPKPYLLQVYSRAFTDGCVRIPLQDERQFKSFAAAFYRLRRRSDSQHASFILPEYHLIFCQWEPERGTALITYDALPDGTKLPPILSVDDASERLPVPQQRLQQIEPQGESEAPFDPDAFMADLIEKAGEKINKLDESDEL